jgi:hypothetical protein
MTTWNQHSLGSAAIRKRWPWSPGWLGSASGSARGGEAKRGCRKFQDHHLGAPVPRAITSASAQERERRRSGPGRLDQSRVCAKPFCGAKRVGLLRRYRLPDALAAEQEIAQPFTNRICDRIGHCAGRGTLTRFSSTEEWLTGSVDNVHLDRVRYCAKRMIG